MRNPITFFLFLVFAFANLLDIVTAFFIQDAESNPIYLLFGNLLGVIILKGAVVWIAYYYTKRNIFPSRGMYYITLMVLILGSLLISMGVASNVWGMTHPEVIEAGKAMSVGEKVSGYGLFISVVYFIPAAFNIFIFWIYDRSLKYAVIDKTFFKKLKWWKL